MNPDSFEEGILTEQKIQNAMEAELKLANSLSEVVTGFKMTGDGDELSHLSTLFKSARWYLISNMRTLLSELYAENGVIQTVIDLPVDDAFRGGFDLEIDELDADEIELLLNTMEREQDLKSLGQARKWTRLYGGGGIVIITDQKSDQKLDVKAIKDSQLSFRAVDLWEMYSDIQWSDFQMDENLQVREMEIYRYYNMNLHKSRFMKMVGIEPPSFIRPRLRGWGLSALEALIRSINQYLKSTNLSFEVLDEFKLDVFHLKDLVNSLMQPDGTTKIQKRVALANQQKNFQNAIVLDKDDEYSQKQLSFAGLAETMEGIRMQIACDLRMPMTKLFGTSSAGFNSGEDDIENYNGMIEGQIRSGSKFELIRMVELRCMQLFGFIPKSIKVAFKPLRVMSAEQEEAIKTNKFNRLLQARQAGEITSKEFRDAVNRENLLGIHLDPEIDEDELGGIDPSAVDDADASIKDPPKPSAKPTPEVSMKAPKSVEVQ